MTRIKNLTRFPIKEIPVVGDTVIGSDSQNNGKTVNFRIESVGGGASIIQNNRAKVINFGVASSPFDGTPLISNAINALPDLSTDYKTVLEDEIVLFEGWVFTGRRVSTFNTYMIVGNGKGIYGENGDITLTEDDIKLVESSLVTNFPPLADDPNANIIDVGALDGTDVLTVINEEVAGFTVVAGTNWYFEGTVDGNRILYGFKGANGTYGSGNTPMTSDDIFLIFDENNPPIIEPSGLETIDEGNGNGLRVIGRNPDNFGNIGLGAIDLSRSEAASSSYGATGENSFAQGQNVTASGYSSIAAGFDSIASGTFSMSLGFGSTASGYLSTAIGLNNVVSGSYSTSLGASNLHTGLYGSTIGLGLINRSTSTAVVGQGNLDYTNTSGSINVSTAPMFIVGNGSLNAGNPNTVNTRSDAFNVLYNGSVLAPSLTIALINADVTGKMLINKEYFQANSGSSLEGYAESGSQLLGDLLINIGDTTGSGNGNEITIDDVGNELQIISETGYLTIGDPNENGGGVFITMDNSFGVFQVQAGNNGINMGNGGSLEIIGDGLQLRPSSGGSILPNTVGQALVAVDTSGTVEWANVGGGTALVDEGNGVGLVIQNQPSANVGDVGLNAVSLVFSDIAGSFGATATDSIAIGKYATASGLEGIAIGRVATASGLQSSIAIGGNASGLQSIAIKGTASGSETVAIGRFTSATNQGSTAIGYTAVSSGRFATALGYDIDALSRAEIAVGTFATTYTPADVDFFNAADRIFVVGYGQSTGSRADALTILKNGNMGVDINNFEANDTGEKLQVNGKIKAVDVNFSGLPEHADEAAAVTAGLATGDMYQTATGELRIKL